MTPDLTTQKGQIIITALYLVSGSLDKEEPLRCKLRSKGLDLLSSLNPSPISKGRIEDGEVRESCNHIFEIVTLLEVTYTTGLISQTNFEILKNELATLSKILEQKEENPLLSMFNNERGFPSLIGDNIDQLSSSRRNQSGSVRDFVAQKDIKDNINIKDTIKDISVDQYKNQSGSVSDFVAKKDINTANPSASVSSSASVLRSSSASVCASIEERKEKIFSILNSNGSEKEFSVTDIAKEFPGCSQKTLQRDLNNLVREGILKKNGEKRWTTYILKT